jgi:hypothetical protein
MGRGEGGGAGKKVRAFGQTEYTVVFEMKDRGRLVREESER